MTGSLMGRVLRSAVVRLPIAVLFLLIAVILRDILLALPRSIVGPANTPSIWLAPRGAESFGWPGIAYALCAAVLMIGLAYASYRLYLSLLERREPSELALSPAPAELLAGVLIGLAMVGAIIGGLWMAQAYQLVGFDAWHLALAPLAASATAAFMEELAVRGVLFRILEEKLGSWLTLGLTSLVFGLLHATNQNASFWSTATIALSAGMVLGAAFMVTRHLWLPIGIHFAVNFAQGGILGLPVSGRPTRGLLASRMSGPSVLTGGDFGLEASVLVLPVSVVLGGLLLWQAWRRQQIRRPSWAKPKLETEPHA